MRKEYTPPSETADVRGAEPHLPEVSSAQAGPSHRNMVHFDQHQSDMIESYAKQRAPSDTADRDRPLRNHMIGVSTEVGVATWKGGMFDQGVYDDYVGDDGVDVVVPCQQMERDKLYQVKGTRDTETPERVVSQRELLSADIFVLCCTSAPLDYVEIVGYTDARTLRAHGDAYGRDGYLLSEEILEHCRGKRYTPEDVREVMRRQR